jgi:hypothetical protein
MVQEEHVAKRKWPLESVQVICRTVTVKHHSYPGRVRSVSYVTGCDLLGKHCPIWTSDCPSDWWTQHMDTETASQPTGSEPTARRLFRPSQTLRGSSYPLGEYSNFKLQERKKSNYITTGRHKFRLKDVAKNNKPPDPILSQVCPDDIIKSTFVGFVLILSSYLLLVFQVALSQTLYRKFR